MKHLQLTCAVLLGLTVPLTPAVAQDQEPDPVTTVAEVDMTDVAALRARGAAKPAAGGKADAEVSAEEETKQDAEPGAGDQGEPETPPETGNE